MAISAHSSSPPGRVPIRSRDAVVRLRDGVGWLALWGGVGVVGLLLVVLPLPQAAMLSGLLLLTLLALHDPVWGLYGAVLSVTVQEVFTLPGDITLTQTTMMLLVVIAGMGFLAFPSRPIRLGRPFLPLAVVIWFYAYSAVFTPYSQQEGFKETLRWMFVGVIYLVSVNTLYRPGPIHNPAITGEEVMPRIPRSPRWPDWGGWWRIGMLVFVILLATAANALVGLWQFITADGPESFAIPGGRFVRAYGTIGHPNSFAGYLNMAWPLAFAIAAGAWVVFLEKHFRQTKGEIPPPHSRATVGLFLIASGATACMFVLGGALFASYSRGGWVGVMGGGAAMFIAFAVILARRFALPQVVWRLGGITAGAGGVLILLLASGMLPSMLTTRLTSIAQNVRLFDVRSVKITPENFAVVERMSHLQSGFAMFLHHPITGVGAGNYTLAYEGTEQNLTYALHPWYKSQGHAHNFYLNLAAETGVGGLAAYLILSAVLLYQAWKTLQCVDNWFAISVAIGCCGILGSVGFHNLFEHLYVLHMGITVGAVWGMLVVLENK